MNCNFAVGDCVICIDASDIPSPPWKPLECGISYIIRSIEKVPEVNGNYDKNVHKHSPYLVRLVGVYNMFHPVFGKEMAYAATRFEKIQSIPDEMNVDTYEEEKIAA